MHLSNSVRLFFVGKTEDDKHDHRTMESMCAILKNNSLSVKYKSFIFESFSEILFRCNCRTVGNF